MGDVLRSSVKSRGCHSHGFIARRIADFDSGIGDGIGVAMMLVGDGLSRYRW